MSEDNAGLHTSRKRCIMHELQITEISGVDVPAQEGAKAVLMKRKDKKDEACKGEDTDVGTQVSDEEDNSANLQTNKAEPTNPEVGNEGVNHVMTDTIEKAAHDEAVAELKAELDYANRMVTMNDTQKAHFLSLEGEAQKAFLAKSFGAREGLVEDLAKAKADSDPVEYVTKGGIELRKSAGPALISLAKSNDILVEKNEKLETAAKAAEYTKRAETELANLPGTVEARVALLKSIDNIEDDGEKALALSALKAHNGEMDDVTTLKGHNGDVAVDENGPDAALNDLAKKYSADNKCDFAKAYAAVLDTEQGADLYAKSLGV